MDKLWTGRTDGQNAALADEFNRSIAWTRRMFRQDIEFPWRMQPCWEQLVFCPKRLFSNSRRAADHSGRSGKRRADESIRTRRISTPLSNFELTSRIGDAGKMLHTARSRNDQVVLDLRRT
jgi:argininosuccinate lyase